MDSNSSNIFLGIKVKPGPIERFKIENFSLENTVSNLKLEAEKKANLPSASLELIHHGKILKDSTSLLECGVKNGEMIHVVKKKTNTPQEDPQNFSDADLQQILTSLRTFGCTPNAPGWTRAMQVLNDESTMSEILEAVPSLEEDCVTLSVLHEVELLAALGGSLNTMRRGAQARPNLPSALRHLIRIVRSQSRTTGQQNENIPTSGFAYSLEALSEDEDADEEEGEEGGASTITADQLAAALQAATEAVAAGAEGSGSQFLRFLRAAGESSTTTNSSPASSGPSRDIITPEMFSDAITEAINRANPSTRVSASTPMDQSEAASSSQSPGRSSSSSEDFSVQLRRMHEMGLLDDALNVRALLICTGDVNAAINLVFSGAIGDE